VATYAPKWRADIWKLLKARELCQLSIFSKREHPLEAADALTR